MRRFILNKLRSKRKSAPTKPNTSASSTFPLSEVPTGSLHAQQQSIFFKMCPIEVRLLIYGAALVDSVRLLHVLHTTPTKGSTKKIGHWRCENPDNAYPTWQHECFGAWVEGSTRFIRDAQYTNGDLMSLLLTCRRIYMEAVEVLYTKNHFSFSAANGIRAFQSLVAPRNWEALRHVHLSTIFLTPISHWDRSLQPPENFEYWEPACRSLAGLPRLQSLCIEIIVWDEIAYQHTKILDEKSILGMMSPLLRVRARQFRVELNLKIPDEIIGTMGQVPFQLLYRQRPYDWETYPV